MNTAGPIPTGVKAPTYSVVETDIPVVLSETMGAGDEAVYLLEHSPTSRANMIGEDGCTAHSLASLGIISRRVRVVKSVLNKQIPIVTRMNQMNELNNYLVRRETGKVAKKHKNRVRLTYLNHKTTCTLTTMVV